VPLNQTQNVPIIVLAEQNLNGSYGASSVLFTLTQTS